MAPTGKKIESNEVCRVTTDMIKPFCGNDDVIAWIKKVRLVAKLKGVVDLASLLPLYLEGDALALYLEMDDEEQKDINVIERKLKTAFSDGPFEAFAKLMNKRWLGETVDVFMNELRRLAGLSGYVGDGLETTIKLAFVNGLPSDIGAQLQQIPTIDEISTSDLLARARVLTSKHIPKQTMCAAGVVEAGDSGGVAGDIGLKSNNNGISIYKSRVKCYRCGGPHTIRNCKVKNPTITCFRCGKPGHIMAQCFDHEQGNSRVGAVAPAATQ